MWDLDIFATVTIHDKQQRWEMTRQFLSLGAKPKESGDKLEIRFRGNRETVLKLSNLCYSCQIHDVHVDRVEY